MSFAVLPNPMKKKYAKMLTAPSKMNVGMYGQIQRFRQDFQIGGAETKIQDSDLFWVFKTSGN